MINGFQAVGRLFTRSLPIYWKYFKYVLRHKWYVFLACLKYGLIWRGIVHDLSKFKPDEFIAYARFFYGDYPWDDARRHLLRPPKPEDGDDGC